MREYENLAYIDLQKTGSGTIKKVLAAVLDEELVRKNLRGVLDDFDRSKTCFVSVREPLSLYISLFNFGVGSQRGGFYRALGRRGRDDLLVATREGFERWLDFVLDPQNAATVHPEYGNGPCDAIGLLSFRLLSRSVPKALPRMRKEKFQEPDQLRELLQKALFNDYVRLENIGGDLFALFERNSSRIQLRRPLTTAEALMADIPFVNSSVKISDLKPDTVSAALRKRVREREWLFYETFGYDKDPKGQPPKSLSPDADAIGISDEATRLGQKGGRRRRRKERRASR